MRIHELKLSQNQKPIRGGRGISAGRGKTVGRGTKGQKSRTGKKLRPGFEGGQNPLIARIPKLAGQKKGARWFSMKLKSQVVSLSDLERIKAKVINVQVLYDQGVISQLYRPVKVISSGQLKTAKTVELQAASKSAIDLISKSGGIFKEVPVLKKAKKIKE